MSDRLEVAIGLLLNERREILLGLRPQHVPQGGLWEFPGGKLDAGETPLQGLTRELKEEIGIEVTCAEPFVNVDYAYPKLTVVLYAFLVKAYFGEPYGVEGQQLQWLALDRLHEVALPAANHQVLQALYKL